MSEHKEHYDRFWLVVGREPGNPKPLVLDRIFHSASDAIVAAQKAAAGDWQKGTVYVVMTPEHAYEGCAPTTERIFLLTPASKPPLEHAKEF